MTVNFDHNRNKRTGIDEVILAGPKQTIDLIEAMKQSLTKNPHVLITRIEKHQLEAVQALAKREDTNLILDRYNRTAILGDFEESMAEPQVAILSGGTSDQPIVEEIDISLRYFGIKALIFPDVGVAGIHRHQEVMLKLIDIESIKVLIVVAGNEGALFSVIAGQTKLPMIAVPASVGYGFGGLGETALRSALQSCSPGVVAVNIDNGFGAASFVKKLLRS